MSENLKIWDSLKKTDPKHTKPFKRAGGFSGTAVAPIYMTQRMTEMFGPAGSGWGMGEPRFETVPGPEGEMLVYCTTSVWWEQPTQLVYGVGGDKAVGKNKYGLFTDDEAFKKAYTDALSNAMKQLGMAADIHMGLYDDNKYVNTLKQEFANKPATTEGIVADEMQGARDDTHSGLERWEDHDLTENAADRALRKLGALIKSDEHTPDEQMLDAHLNDAHDLITATQMCSTWWPGIEEKIKARRDELRTREANPDHRTAA